MRAHFQGMVMLCNVIFGGIKDCFLKFLMVYAAFSIIHTVSMVELIA